MEIGGGKLESVGGQVDIAVVNVEIGGGKVESVGGQVDIDGVNVENGGGKLESPGEQVDIDGVNVEIDGRKVESIVELETTVDPGTIRTWEIWCSVPQPSIRGYCIYCTHACMFFFAMFKYSRTRAEALLPCH